MRFRSGESSELWSVILAGGDGRRVSKLVQSWLGCHKPKQYCAFVGTRSMFQHTVDRAAMVGSLERIVVIVDRSHRTDATAQLEGRSGPKLLFQPSNRGTAAGVLLPLAHVRAMSPDATVIISPSDHFVYPEWKFVEALRSAAAMLDHWPDRLILLGVYPDNPETDYGWILPAACLGRDGGLRAVDSFVEKPDARSARRLLTQGGLWNTLIMVAKMRTIWDLARRHLPGVLALFGTYDGLVGSSMEDYALESIYTVMPEQDFSSALLQSAVDRLAVVSLDGVFWSDWGRPERIVAALRKIGRIPAFPPECFLPSPLTDAGDPHPSAA